ncbi:hypothetical protein SR858_17030 [Duganella zoogloeoides]|uniref:Uncharacterized protein n=1 Tax=Duganella zoogloeoides TaxID=75659 RepID=A0ABZ0XSQ4_9BURK|nr:hypothetical protein [Duganella zoogloeoides]WQH02770.1 hypothetical protein SR858_17030 [Duganella zoogloeoides]
MASQHGIAGFHFDVNFEELDRGWGEVTEDGAGKEMRCVVNAANVLSKKIIERSATRIGEKSQEGIMERGVGCGK